MIAEVVEGGLGPHRLWAHNPPQVAMYPSNNTMVPIAGPLWKINVLSNLRPRNGLWSSIVITICDLGDIPSLPVARIKGAG
jgi:hypothetical protein